MIKRILYEVPTSVLAIGFISIAAMLVMTMSALLFA